MILDYHMHLERDDHEGSCPYTVERVRLYVERAQARGAAEIGITEHCNRFGAFRPAMEFVLKGEPDDPFFTHSFREDLAEYVDMLLAAQRLGLPVKASIEADYIPGEEARLREILAAHPFDYIIGSVHFLDEWPIDYSPDYGWPQADVDRAYADYFNTLAAAARSGLFDVLAHPDLVKKFGHVPSFPIDELYDEVAKALAEAGVAAEVSSAGLRKPVGELYPSQALLERLHDRGVPITLGSDAHQPDEVALDFDRAVRAAQLAGYREVARFTKRRRELVPLG